MSVTRLASRTAVSVLAILAFVADQRLSAEPVQDGAAVSLALTGHVTLRCDAQLEELSGAAVITREGQLTETCNDPQGYELHVDYAAGFHHLKLVIEGIPYELDGSGTVVVARSFRPQQMLRRWTLEAPAHIGSTAAISFRIVPASRRI